MLSSPVFRYAKPVIQDLRGLLFAKTVAFTETNFTDRVLASPMNRAMFDVIRRSDGVMLNRAFNDANPEYWFANGYLNVRDPGDYKLRVYASIIEFEDNVISVGKRIPKSDGGAFISGIPFWPQIMSQPEFGFARISNDGKNIAYVSQVGAGLVSFSYRLVNAYGQVTEPACVRITSTQGS